MSNLNFLKELHRYCPDKKFISFIAQSRLVAALDILLLSCESSTPLALVLD